MRRQSSRPSTTRLGPVWSRRLASADAAIGQGYVVLRRALLPGERPLPLVGRRPPSNVRSYASKPGPSARCIPLEGASLVKRLILLSSAVLVAACGNDGPTIPVTNDP